MHRRIADFYLANGILEILSVRFGVEAEAVRPRLLKIKDSSHFLRLVPIALVTNSVDAFATHLPGD